MEKQKRVFPIIYDQCLPLLRSQLEEGEAFKERCEKNDIVELLKLIRGFCCKHDQNNNKYYIVINSLCALFINFQKNDKSNVDYLKEFQACMATLNDYNENVVDLVPCLMEDALKEIYGATMDTVIEEEI